ncbi:uncharacterized protein LOC127750288 [Frankliniella occidentalis]|uniref:Uncharacterized protein LOC127750288 n=1 Tax=Frankliniella occidentalis TaxID=133901 RepID=A0A9C6X1K7_FRAOC|nr:uncharacterized protein LOC127750288 [Frankliniella occidentalis]
MPEIFPYFLSNTNSTKVSLISNVLKKQQECFRSVLPHTGLSQPGICMELISQANIACAPDRKLLAGIIHISLLLSKKPAALILLNRASNLCNISGKLSPPMQISSRQFGAFVYQCLEIFREWFTLLNLWHTWCRVIFCIYELSCLMVYHIYLCCILCIFLSITLLPLLFFFCDSNKFLLVFVWV